MLTGSIPSFWDVIWNYNTTELEMDNLLRRYQEKYPLRKILFYGDETWMKLFPSKIFSRSEPLQSFFVNDFHQVLFFIDLIKKKKKNDLIDDLD